MPAWGQPNDELEDGIRRLAAWRALVCLLQHHSLCMSCNTMPMLVPKLIKPMIQQVTAMVYPPSGA
jgi:hypothetical protein